MEHLPECLRIVGKVSGPCICWLLHTCEQRVLDEATQAVLTAQAEAGEVNFCKDCADWSIAVLRARRDGGEA